MSELQQFIDESQPRDGAFREGSSDREDAPPLQNPRAELPQASSLPDTQANMREGYSASSSVGVSRRGHPRRVNHRTRTSERVPPTEEHLEVPLRERIWEPGNRTDSAMLAELEKDIENQIPDMFVLSLTGTVHAVNRNILAKMSGYFDAITRSGMVELESNMLRMKIDPEPLRVLFSYAYNGRITLRQDNIVRNYESAHYLQMDPLLEIFDRFLIARVRQLPIEIYSLGVRCMRDELADAALRSLCRFPMDLVDKGLLNRLDIELLKEIFSNNDLHVQSEDEACRLIVQWIRAIPHCDRDIRSAVECLRLPHISETAAQELTETLDQCGIEVPLFTMCRNGSFDNVSEDSLNPRRSHAVHVHLFWQDQMDNGPTGREAYRCHTSCTRFKANVVYTNHILNGVQHSIDDRNFEFVTAGDRIMKVTQNKKLTKLIVESVEPSGCLKHRATFERNVQLSDFAVCDDGPRCIVSYFDDFGEPPKFSACDTTDWTRIEKFYSTPSRNLRFSPREMGFYSDIVFVMRNHTVIIADRHAATVTELEIPEKLCNNKFVNFIRIDNKVYIYEDHGFTINRYLRDDRIHVVNLETKRIENSISVEFKPRDQDLEISTISLAVRVRKLLRFGKEVLIVVQDETFVNVFFIRFNPEDETFSSPVAIKAHGCRVARASFAYSRTYLMQVPVYIHWCRHESLLQRHLRTLKGSQRAVAIERFKNYL